MSYSKIKSMIDLNTLCSRSIMPCQYQYWGMFQFQKRLKTLQAAQTLFVIYIRDSIALRFEPFKRMYVND